MALPARARAVARHILCLALCRRKQPAKRGVKTGARRNASMPARTRMLCYAARACGARRRALRCMVNAKMKKKRRREKRAWRPGDGVQRLRGAPALPLARLFCCCGIGARCTRCAALFVVAFCHACAACLPATLLPSRYARSRRQG